MINQESEEIPKITQDKIKSALKEMKINRVPGDDETFYSIDQEKMLAALAGTRIDYRYSELIKYIYKSATAINIDEEKLSHLRFADDIVLISDSLDEASEMLNRLNIASCKVDLKINLEKIQLMTNLYIEQDHKYKYLGHEICIRRDNQTTEELKRSEIFSADIPICLKKKVYNQCILPILTYEAETLTLTKKTIAKIQTTQRAMNDPCSMGITLRDRIPNKIIRERTGNTE
ncbi:hypothetical protein ACFW04_014615 [Cataglyphis niger]